MSNDRLYYLDWLRMFAIIGVLFFHSAMPYVTEETWHIKNEQTSNLLLEFNYWLSRFRMPLLFFVSGGVTYFILQKKNGWQFVGIRFKRLIVPLIFGMLVIVPPQVYLERVNQGFTGSFLDFYPRIFNIQPYPQGDTSWHHLWFIAYLFVYNLLAAPLFVFLISRRGKLFMQKLEFLGRGLSIYLLIIPGVLWFTFTVFDHAQTNDLVNDFAFFPYWFFFLLVGYLCIVSKPLADSLERNRRLSLLLAFASILFINYFRWNELEPWDQNSDFKNHWESYAAISLRPFTAWLWVFAIVGYGKRYLNKNHRTLKYINESLYPFYILHQTVIVILSFYIVKTTDTILMKYAFTILVTFGISMLIFHLIIRPYNAMRFLFGMAPLKSSKPEVKQVGKTRMLYTEETLSKN